MIIIPVTLKLKFNGNTPVNASSPVKRAITTVKMAQTIFANAVVTSTPFKEMMTIVDAKEVMSMSSTVAYKNQEANHGFSSLKVT